MDFDTIWACILVTFVFVVIGIPVIFLCCAGLFYTFLFVAAILSALAGVGNA